MRKLPPLVLLLLSIGAVTAQKAAQSNGRPIPQWLMGLIAVSCFLLITFVGLLVKKILCDKPGRRADGVELAEQTDMVMDEIYDRNLDVLRSRRRSSDEEKGEDSEVEYDTNLDAIREVRDAASRGSENDRDETYDTSEDVLRLGRSATSGENAQIYTTNLDVLRSKERHAYVNEAMESEGKATVM